MKHLLSILIVIISMSLSSCHGKKGNERLMTQEDSIRVNYDKAYQIRLSALQNVREDLTGPMQDGDASVRAGEKFKTSVLNDSIDVITIGFEKLKAKLEHAQKDSSTVYGPLLTRFRLLNSQHKYLTATYTDAAHLLRYTEEVTFDEKHEEDRDFYFNNGDLVYFRERHAFTQEEQDVVTEDSYFLRNGKVVYAYRDEGSALERKDRMNLIPTKRSVILGDLTAHVSKEFTNFKHDYDILLSQRLEPLLYTGGSALN